MTTTGLTLGSLGVLIGWALTGLDAPEAPPGRGPAAQPAVRASRVEMALALADVLLAPAVQQATEPAASGLTPSPVAPDDVQRRQPWASELGTAAVSEEENPLVDIAQQMKQAGQRLGAGDSGPQTQDLQKRIVAALDQLLQQARNRPARPSQSPASSQSPAPRTAVQQPAQPPGQTARNPMPDSVRQPGTSADQPEPRRVDPASVRQLLSRVWGELPEHQRQQMLQLPVEDFLPKYELLIEQYFRRLAEPER